MVHLVGISIPNMINIYLFPPDVFFRHKVIADAVGTSGQILDVGGSLGELRRFLPDSNITTADVVKGADIVFNGKVLPLPDNSYDTVVSVDTLEHIPQKERLPFINELCRVSKKQVVLLAPYGSVAHSKAERKLLDSYQRQHRPVPNYLVEHVKYGLPDDMFLRSLEHKFAARASLRGWIWLDRVNFAIHTFETKNGKLNQLFYRGKFLWNLTINLFLIPILSRAIPSPDVASRFLAVIEKSKPD